MDSYEWNKIFGWILAAGIAVLGLSILTGIAYPGSHSDEKAYVVEGVEEEVADAGAAGEAAQPIAAFMAAANVAKGEAQFKKCAACHTVNKGGANNQGPNLWGIMGAEFAHMAGFGYSDALKAKEGKWDWDAMSAWLESPRKFIPGNKMSFAGISKPQDRADLLAYLNAQSDSPLPLPAAPAIAEASASTETAEAAPGAGEAAALPAPGAEVAPVDQAATQ